MIRPYHSLRSGLQKDPGREDSLQEMQAVHREYRMINADEGLNLALQSVKVPAPRASDVLVRIHAVSLNNLDALVIQGQYHGQKDKVVPCSDMAGEVVAVGAEVKDWTAGDRVCANFIADYQYGPYDERYKSSFMGFVTDGVLTEYKVFPSHALVRIPDYLSYQEASTLPCTAVTAWNCFQGPDPLKPGETVLVQGTGNVSLTAIQLAVALGAIVIATSSSDEKLKIAQGLGARHLINYKEHPEWHENVLEVTGGRGVDHVVEIGGTGTIIKSLRSVRSGGYIHGVGFVAQGNATELMDLPYMLISRAITLRGVLIGSRTQFEELCRMLAVYKIRPLVDKVFTFDQVPEAFAYLGKQIGVGKVIIQVSKSDG
ncbi:hypothetical protein EIP91_010964 [Steccherinum ochraceum]|uniref:Enoyl reductase (ER) domain-containing protein n=1 Tax=Steccherinum ochraceum TaxID=92696 RepID=A0A4R0RL93_9APHY|nr:hypothetical protein EIP91_010964 [Steccherinum ochraceum]